MPKHKNLLGQKFGLLTVVERTSNNKQGKTQWICLCVCGTSKVVNRDGLVRGSTKSCGCIPHHQPITHGCYQTAEYKIWLSLKNRCKNPKCPSYPNYGGRGIGVCDRWDASFENFILDMGWRPNEGLSIDRIDNEGSYEPSNCRWSTRTEQNSNKRDNLIVEYKGQAMTFAQAYRASASPTSSPNAFKRYKRGWPLEDALHTPPQRRWKVKKSIIEQTRGTVAANAFQRAA